MRGAGTQDDRLDKFACKRKSCEMGRDYGPSQVGGRDNPRWEELKKGSEGNVVPSKTEGWNHPITSSNSRPSVPFVPRCLTQPPALVVFVVSAEAANPLQAFLNLHARQIDLPPWVDPTCIRCTLVIQRGTSSTSLSDPMYVHTTRTRVFFFFETELQLCQHRIAL